jgi:signal transduction histidine kinase
MLTWLGMNNKTLNDERNRSPRYSLWLFIIILAILVATAALWDYFRVRKITNDLATRQVRGLIHQVEKAAKTATYTEQALQEMVIDHLFAVAYSTGRCLEKNEISDIDFQILAVEGGIRLINVYNSNGEFISGTDYHAGIADMLGGLIQPENTIGYFTIDQSNIKYYGISVNLPDGRIIVTAINAEEMINFRKDIGFGSLFSDLTEHPEVRYALFDSPHGIIAATQELPEWIGTIEDPMREHVFEEDGFHAAFVDRPDGLVFEAHTPFGNDGVVLRLGLYTDELQKIHRRSLIALILRTILFIVASVFLAAYFISHQNARLLSEERVKILKDVRKLEADRTLRERLAAMGALAGGVAHEIRNPLNTVSMAAQRLDYEFEPSDDVDEYHSLVKSLKGETDRIGRIVEDFLKYARPPKPNRQMQSLEETLSQVVNTFRPLAEAKDVELDVTYGNIPDFAFDADQVRQLALNLLRNALDAIPESNGHIRFNINQDEGSVVIQVEDNGTGVPDDIKSRIFDLYFTTKSDGTGVGLPTVNRIAVEHGGKVEILDSKDGGAIFRVSLQMEEISQ